MVRASPTFADLGDDVIEELARDFERELDVIADELQTVTASADAGCTISSGGHDDYLRRALDDQELRALFQELEPSTDDKAEGDAVTVADTTTATIKPSIDTQAEARERECSSANTIGNNSGTNNSEAEIDYEAKARPASSLATAAATQKDDRLPVFADRRRHDIDPVPPENPLVLVAVPLVHALASWMAKLYRNSSRGTKERTLGAMKIAVVLASVIGVYFLTMALTQPLSRFREKDH
eukprot:jgi/Undpi1/5844/HiC_scaffold_2.g01118.m1